MANTLRRIAASSVVALAFSPLAQAGGLIDDPNALLQYTPALSKVLAQAAGNDMAHFRAGGFMKELENTLKAPADKPLFVDYPKPVSANMLRVIAVVPPKGYETLPIPVCAEQNNKVLGTWNITSKGEVIPAPWEGSKVSATPTSSACRAFIMASRDNINQRVAEGNDAKKPVPNAALAPQPEN